MLDIKFIRENSKEVKKGAKLKGYDVDRKIDDILRLDKERRKIITEIEKLRAIRNEEISKIKKKPQKEILEKLKKLKEDILKNSIVLRQKEKLLNNLLLQIPNIPSPNSPLGKDENDNKVIKVVGKPKKFNFPIKDHIELGNNLGLLDLERGVKIGGPRSYVLQNELVILEQALLRYALDYVKSKGFMIMNVPVLVKEEVLEGSGFFPFGREDIYEINKKNHFLVGTSEASLVYYYSGEILKESELPKLLSAITPCFRKEAGTYGKDTKGLVRVHQFYKVEQVVLCKKEDSEKMFNFILKVAEDIVKSLDLPYRLVEICTGDMGPKNHRQVDLEVWFPAQKRYRETHSCSYLTDYQGRRSNIRYKDNKGNKFFVHTLNNTAIATPRVLGAILENYQQKDGSIKVPKILQQYTDFREIKRR